MALRACETMMKEPKLAITVHDSIADALTYRLEQLASRLPAATDIVILRDAAMPPADCRIEWNNGGMERNTEQLWRQVEQAVEDMTATAKRDAGAYGLTVESCGLPQAQLPRAGGSERKQ